MSVTLLVRASTITRCTSPSFPFVPSTGDPICTCAIALLLKGVNARAAVATLLRAQRSAALAAPHALGGIPRCSTVVDAVPRRYVERTAARSRIRRRRWSMEKANGRAALYPPAGAVAAHTHRQAATAAAREARGPLLPHLVHGGRGAARRRMARRAAAARGASQCAAGVHGRPRQLPHPLAAALVAAYRPRP